MVSDEMMQAILVRNRPDLEAAAKKLIDAANANGGVDNVTVVLAQYEPQ